MDISLEGGWSVEPDGIAAVKEAAEPSSYLSTDVDPRSCCLLEPLTRLLMDISLEGGWSVEPDGIAAVKEAAEPSSYLSTDVDPRSCCLFRSKGPKDPEKSPDTLRDWDNPRDNPRGRGDSSRFVEACRDNEGRSSIASETVMRYGSEPSEILGHAGNQQMASSSFVARLYRPTRGRRNAGCGRSSRLRRKPHQSQRSTRHTVLRSFRGRAEKR